MKKILAKLSTVFLILCSVTGNAQNVSGSNELVTDVRVKALEKSCVLNLRTLNVAQAAYQRGDDSKGFARTLKQLGPDGESFVDAVTVSGVKDGYRFQLVAKTNHAKSVQHYKIIARPVDKLTDSQRSYYTDESGVIRFTEEARRPAASDPPLEPPYER